MALPSLPPVVLAACTGLLLLGGIAGAATVDGDGEETAAAPTELPAPSDTTVPAPPAAAGEAGGVAGVPAPVPAAPGSVPPSTTATPAPVAPAATTTTTSAPRPRRAGAPGPLVAPKPGSYAYDATTTSSTGTRTARSTTTVEAAGTEGASTLQTITIPLELGGQQGTARNAVAWGADGAVVRRSVITVMGQQLDCTWQPAFAQYAGGLAVGRTWSFDTRCTALVQGFEVTIQQRATRRVTGTAQVAGPAGPVAAWNIADDTTVVVTSPLGVTNVRSVGTQQLAPSLGVPLRTEAKVESTTTGSAPQQATVTTKLVTLP